MRIVFCILLSLVAGDHQGIPHNLSPKSEPEVIIPGDSNYKYDLANQEKGPLNMDTASNYMNLIMDINMCAVEVIYKYNMSDAITQTKEIVS